MKTLNETVGNSSFDELAESSGLAVAVLDRSGREIFTANNNSICRTLNPSGAFTGACAEFCGKALEKVSGDEVARYECHAGLECRVVPIRSRGGTLAAIVGRAFVHAENYRMATERAVRGDWRPYSPASLFENVLLADSERAVDDAAERVRNIITSKKARIRERSTAEAGTAVSTSVSDAIRRDQRTPGRPLVIREEDLPPETAPPTARQPDRRTAEASAWRSFFGSLLNTDFSSACDSIMRFIAAQHGLRTMIWLDRKGDRLENSLALGELRNRRVRLGIAADDPRLRDAVAHERPLELGGRSAGAPNPRVISVFPITVGGHITSALAILDPLTDQAKFEIVRICSTVAPQLEILSLRSKVDQNESVARAVRRFGQSLKQLDANDFWHSIVQVVAEIMQAERASLLVPTDEPDELALKAAVGIRDWAPKGGEVGGRVARLVLEKNKALATADVSRTGLPPAPAEWGYRSPSFLSCPVSIGDRAIGVMNFTDRVGGGTFDRRSLELYQAIAPQLAVAIDRAELKHKAGEFEQLSVTDSLTGLLNRRYLDARLAEEVRRSNRYGFPMSFMMLDVDHFKQYNDKFGHLAGDEALKIVADVIKDTVRGADVAARVGGEEFAILLPQTNNEEAIIIGERIRQNIESTTFPNRRVTVSIGVVSCSAEISASANVVDAADKALYEAKRRGRNRVMAFEDMRGRARARSK